MTTLLKKNTDKFLFVVYGNKETHNLSIGRELEHSFRNRTFLSRPHPQVPGISEKKKGRRDVKNQKWWITAVKLFFRYEQILHKTNKG